MEEWRVTSWAPGTGLATVVYLGTKSQCNAERQRLWDAQQQVSSSDRSLGARVARETEYQVEPANPNDQVGFTVHGSVGDGALDDVGGV